MNTLSPQQAARIAKGVYELRHKRLTDLRAPLGCEGSFRVGGASRFTGVSGAVITDISGFGYLAEGEGRYEGEVLCATRGTATGYDWGTNLNIGLKQGPGGLQVHAGFRDLWYSAAAEIRSFLRGRNPTHIHCVGHSLGGALAMLNADFFSSLRIAPVSVYTFGAPRVGMSWFAESLTSRVGGQRMFRLSHSCDPVPMIPVMPFVHAPSKAPALMVRVQSKGLPVSIEAHLMDTGYIPALADRSWDSFRVTDTEVTETEVREWMNATSAGQRVGMYSASALNAIGRVLSWLLKKSGQLIINSVGLAATASLTLLDRMAWMIESGARLSAELASYTEAMLRAVFRFLGRTAKSTYDLTVGFLRWALGLLYSTVGGLASRALART